jgi:hypothetical protein
MPSRRDFLAATLSTLWSAAALADEFPNGVRDTLGPQFAPRAAGGQPPMPIRRGPGAIDRFRYWNQVAIDASGLDHTPVAAGETRTFGEQLGPGRASRAIAIVHIAMFDAINAIAGGYRGYTNLASARRDTSIDAAIACAAHDALCAVYPSQAPYFGQLFAADLDDIKQGSAASKVAGVALGGQAAAAILAMRASDGSAHAEARLGFDYFPGLAAGDWRQDPISQGPLALGAHWGAVAPFALSSGAQFRAPPPPAMSSAAYTQAFQEVARYGGDNVHTPSQRTADQTQAAIFWAYDGMPSLCAPPRLYNQLAMQIADHFPLRLVDLARLMALVNVAMADAGVAIWESKYHYAFWRPVTGIRESDPGTGPSGSGDGNTMTFGIADFMPLGAPASNLTGPNFTPPFPAYPSGHAGFGGALFETLRRFFGTDAIPFTFVSDEFNGKTQGNDGLPRPLKPRSFATLSQAEEENGQSRIYLGIHWAFDKTAGIAQGRRVADYVFDNLLRPIRA